MPVAGGQSIIVTMLCSQISRCTYHNTAPQSLSLLHDYQAGIEQLPTQLAQVQLTPPLPVLAAS